MTMTRYSFAMFAYDYPHPRLMDDRGDSAAALQATVTPTATRTRTKSVCGVRGRYHHSNSALEIPPSRVDSDFSAIWYMWSRSCRVPRSPIVFINLPLHERETAMERITYVSPLVGIGLCVLLLCAASVRCATALPSGLVAWWPGDSNANDLSGNGHHAMLANGAQAGVPGLMSGAFQLNGVTAFVSTPLLLPSQGTIDLWVKPADLTDDIYGIFGTFGILNGNDRLWLNVRGANGGLGIDPNNLVVNAGYCCVNEIVVPSPLLIGTWTHVALTFDYETDSFTLYINGSIAGASLHPLTDRPTPTQSLDFGGHRSDFGQNFYWNGLIDEVHVFNRVLTPQEILALAAPVIFTGFFPPISNPPVQNEVKAGQAIPVTFSLDGDQGLNIFATGYPKSQEVLCDTDDPINDVQQTLTAGGSSLTYNPSTDQYTYVWKSDKSWGGTCRQLIIQLTDGTEQVAHFHFR